MKTKRNAFTLIELLAVIVILAIIALIATPIILGIINDAKENAFKRSIDGIVRSALTESTLNIRGDDIVYQYENNEWEKNKLDIDGQIPKYITIKVNKEGNVTYAITDGVYCAIKKLNSELKIKKISNKNSDKEIQEEYCTINVLPPTDINCFTFADNANNKEIKDYTCSDIKEVVIPEGVTSIGEYAFNGKGLTNVIISDGVTSIGKNAFATNQLTDIMIPDSVTTIGFGAFQYNSLNNIIIPSSVTNIEDSVFRYNQLTRITIPDSVTNIGEWAFYDNNLTSVTIPSSVTSIGESAFSTNKLESVIISKGVKSIGQQVFDNNLLKSVTIPSSVTNIGGWAFRNNKLRSITIPDSVISMGKAAFNNNLLPDNQAFIYNRNSDGSIDYSKIVSYGGEKRNDVIIPLQANGTTLKIIGDSAFSYNELASITIPNSVINIGSFAFDNNLLTSITIPNSVTSIGNGAFKVNKLANIDLSNCTNLTTIGSSAFSKFRDYSNPGLTKIKTNGKEFDWNSIINGTSGTSFVTGIVENAAGNVTIE